MSVYTKTKAKSVLKIQRLEKWRARLEAQRDELERLSMDIDLEMERIRSETKSTKAHKAKSKKES